jgi:hypothetical protein
MELSGSFFDTVIKLVQIGGIGIGALIFLFVFLLLLRNQPVDSETAKLRTRYLYLGTAFAVLALGVSLLQPKPAPPGAGHLVVTYSPKLSAAGLPTPEMMLMDGNAPLRVEPDQEVPVSNAATLKISADDLIAQARNLQSAQEAAKVIVAANSVSSTAPAPGSTGAAPAPAPVQPGPALPTTPAGGATATTDPATPTPIAVAPPIKVSPVEMNQIKNLQSVAAANLAKGDFAAAEQASKSLRIHLERVAPGALAAHQ